MTLDNRAQPSLIRIDNVSKTFPVASPLREQFRIAQGRLVRQQKTVKAVNGVSLDIERGEALCVVGESGCGKSTLARLVMGLLATTQGQVLFEGERIDHLPRREMLPYRKKMQMIFQNPYASLNPRMTVWQTLEEPLRFHQPSLGSDEVRARIEEVMVSVGVDRGWGERYPHEFSGGQRQRISIARALMVNPVFIAADEPISALDVSIQAQVLNVLMDAQETHNLTYLFITHDLSVVEHFGTRIAVMYLGTLCELAEAKALFEAPRHPYTQALLSAVPRLRDSRPNFIKLAGEVSTPLDLPSGCVFHKRCQHANERCRQEVPVLQMVGSSQQVACHAVVEGRL